ncbi:hypothetical protein [Amycolatopsis mediterranei]|nr:hypothetical protein [Amycolatopsis mediterranei]
MQRFLADSEQAVRPTGDLIAEARALTADDDFKEAVDTAPARRSGDSGAG